MQPEFLQVEDVLMLHSDQVDLYGGEHGVRDLGLLDSAIAQPRATFDGEFLHADMFEMAAAYMFHIVQNHPFLDGNKRTGAAAAIIFLSMNDVEIKADEEGLVDLTLAVARGEVGKSEIAAFFRERAH